MRRTACPLLLVGLLTSGLAREARAETRVGLDVGPILGRTQSVIETTDPQEPGAPPREGAGGLEVRVGAVGEHFVAGGSLTAWGATSSAGSAAAFAGVAARSHTGFAAELAGSLGGQLYDGYLSGGFYSDVSTTSVFLPYAGAHLQVWAPLSRTASLGLFAEARTDLQHGTGTATVTTRCGFFCDVLGGGMVPPPEVHTFAVGGQSFFVGVNVRFSATPGGGTLRSAPVQY